MSLLPQPKITMPIGHVDKETGEVTFSKEFFMYVQALYNYTIGASLSTSEAELLASAEIDQGPIVAFNGLTGTQTATFTATNKPGTGTTAPSEWIQVEVNGFVGYIPVWK